MLSLKDIDPVLIVVAASALLLAFFLGYALRSYVYHRRRLRRRLRAGTSLMFGGYPLIPPGAAGEKADPRNDKPERPQITDGHPLRKAIFTIIIYGGTKPYLCGPVLRATRPLLVLPQQTLFLVPPSASKG